MHLPQLAPFKKLASEFADLAVDYQKSGKLAEQQSVLEAAWTMGTQLRNYGENATLLQDLVGLAMQNMALQRWPEGVEPTFLPNKTISEKSAENRATRVSYRESSGVFNAWLPNAPEHEIIAYYGRLRTFGENNAMTWLKARHPDLVPARSR